jgi:hypothetical protein
MVTSDRYTMDNFIGRLNECPTRSIDDLVSSLPESVAALSLCLGRSALSSSRPSRLGARLMQRLALRMLERLRSTDSSAPRAAARTCGSEPFSIGREAAELRARKRDFWGRENTDPFTASQKPHRSANSSATTSAGRKLTSGRDFCQAMLRSLLG